MREYKRYEEYQDSGVEWIGEIPKAWNLIRFKYLFSYQKGNSPNEYVGKSEGIPYLSMDYLRGNNDEITYVSNDPNMIKVENNQILLLWDGSNSGEFIKSKKGLLSSTMSLITDIKIDKEFSYHYFKSSEKYLKDQTIGMGIPHVDSKILKNLHLSVPEKDEQQKIASFLDQKTAEIDEIISKKETLIDHLEKFKKSVITEAVTKGKLGDKYINKDGELVDEIEMKDSGIEWIDDVPNNWEVNYIKYYCSKITDGSHHSPAQQSEGRPYITVRNIEENNINFNSCSYLSEDNYNELVLSGCKPKSGDVLLSKDGTVGKVVIVNDNDFVVLSSIAILRPKSNNLLSNFLFYILKSNYLENQMNSFMAGAAIKRITITDINKFIIIVPQLNIQNEIINYLNKKTNQINNLIQRTKESIEKYKEYKKSLIFEAVTGKIDLRDYELEGGEELAEHNNSSETERESISAVD
ncbi:restriction endonuclease subunit S [Halanaerobium congolense]|nr:restriction endonuclease subunit S [Halanaerobium congolense]